MGILTGIGWTTVAAVVGVITVLFWGVRWTLQTADSIRAWVRAQAGTSEPPRDKSRWEDERTIPIEAYAVSRTTLEAVVSEAVNRGVNGKIAKVAEAIKTEMQRLHADDQVVQKEMLDRLATLGERIAENRANIEGVRRDTARANDDASLARTTAEKALWVLDEQRRATATG